MESRKKSEYAIVTLKGMAMGAADLVPGVSGGTIAFISGIYEELVDSIKNIDFTALKLLFTGKFKSFWKKINGTFLISLVLGIIISFFSLAKLMTFLLHNEPIPTWAFFFGLILASAVLIGKDVKRWRVGTVLLLLIGIAFGYMITILSPATTPETWWFIMFSGAVAICAMLLPGISGAFILLLMGKYAFLMTAVSELNIPIILLFVSGALIGIVSFSHFLSWLLDNHYNVAVSFLTGVMVGSINKIWPWKKVLETYTDANGNIHPLVETNITPNTFEALTGASSQIGSAILFFIIGLALIFVLEYISKRVGKKREDAVA